MLAIQKLIHAASPGGNSKASGKASLSRNNSSSKRLITSIHDVSPAFEAEIVRLFDLLYERVGPKLALLVVPDLWGQAPIRPGSPFATRLQRWADKGCEVFLHGWSHKDTHRHQRLADRFRSRHMTAGEGEFLGLDTTEAASRMRDGRDLLEDIIGRPLSGFVAPAWLYGAGAYAAMSAERFAIAEDHFRVWHPPTGTILSRGPVITWASRSRMRTFSSLAFAGAAPHLMSGLKAVRLAVHPGDVHVPVIMNSIDTTLSTLLRHRRPGRYLDLFAR